MGNLNNGAFILALKGGVFCAKKNKRFVIVNVTSSPIVERIVSTRKEAERWVEQMQTQYPYLSLEIREIEFKDEE